MDSDDEMMVQLFTEEQNAEPFFVVPRRDGSKPGNRRNINRHRQADAMLLDADYFNDDATHSPKEFWRRFRINKELFLKIVYSVREAPPDTSNGYLRMAESTCTETLYRFCRAVISVFAKDYLRAPREDDIARILQKLQQEGFLGCSEALTGIYKGHAGECIVILEAVADHDLWIWHAFFGMAGTNNDFNVLQRSSVFARLAEGQAPAVNFEKTRWKLILQHTRKQLCKDVERAFGVFQHRFAILSGFCPTLIRNHRFLTSHMGHVRTGPGPQPVLQLLGLRHQHASSTLMKETNQPRTEYNSMT
ncbi:uncharacterized protein [Lolium perenne]|uniref:uncharacterized protein n=1 Tax=Lolium perenne TaxID=4522 RepID=UPI003A9A0FAC